jgi:hypothetical protein
MDKDAKIKGTHDYLLNGAQFVRQVPECNHYGSLA